MITTLEKILYWITANFMGGDAASHIQVRGALDDHTMVTTSDSLMTVIEIFGSKKLIGEREFNDQADILAEKVSSYMKSGNGKLHAFGISFRSSPESRAMISDATAASIRTALRLGVSEKSLDYFKDQETALAGLCVEETVYLVATTSRLGLSPAEREKSVEWSKKLTEKMSAAMKDVGGSRVDGNFGQAPRFGAPVLINRHHAMISNLISDLTSLPSSKGVGLLVRKLSAEEGLAVMRQQIDVKGVPKSWRPRLLGASAAHGLSIKSTGDQSLLMPPPVARQIITKPITEQFDGDAELAIADGMRYASMVMVVPPESGRGAFNWLAKRVGRTVPWSMSIEITPDGLNSRAMDKAFAGFSGGLGDFNARVKSAWEYLKKLEDYVCAVRITLTTWGPTAEIAYQNLSFLRSAVESWESATVTNETGNPALALLSSAAGLTKRSPAPFMPGPITDMARMLPMFRPASIWTSGQLLAHTLEGRLYPVQFGSTEQVAWGLAGFAPTGSGKSFTLSMMNFGIMMSPGQKKIPPLVVVDVGPGSSYVMKLVHAMLPENRKHEVAWLRVRNDKHHTVNPFDTQPGCDSPTEVDMDFLVNVLTTICPSLGPEGDKFCARVIREAYRKFGRMSPDCRAWQSSLDPDIHAKLNEVGFPFESYEKVRVWDIEDWLFKRGHIDLFKKIHRYAVPRLSDMVGAAQAKVIQDQYGGDNPAMTPNGENITSVFVRNITAAQDTYELISGYTRFDIGNARAVAIDLEEVVGSITSEEGRRRSGLMFLFARRLGARNFFLRWEEMEPIIPDLYKEYYRSFIDEMEGELKFLEYDEKHYTTGVGSVDKMIEIDVRVGRKYKMVTMLFSQQLADFNAACISNCYTYLVMGKDTNSSSQALQSTFNLSDSEIEAINSLCTRPGRLFGLFRTTSGDTSQVLFTKAGPFMQWAFTTTKDDVLLRNELERRMSYLDAVRALATVFPDGSARDALSLMRKTRTEVDSGARSESAEIADKVLQALSTGNNRSLLV